MICLAMNIYVVKTAHKETTSLQKAGSIAAITTPGNSGQPQQNISRLHYLFTKAGKKPFELLIHHDVAAEVKMSWFLVGFSVFIIAIVVAGKLKGKLL